MNRPAAVLVLAAVLGCGSPPPSEPPPGTPRERVFIPEGASFQVATDSLVAHGIVTNPRWFRLLARLAAYDRRIRPGLYELPKGWSARRVLRALASGKGVMVRFTVPEGLTLIEMAELAEERLRVPADSFLAAARDTALLREFGVAAPSLEGFLMPETYVLPAAVTARGLVRHMATTFQEEWDAAWDSLAAAAGLSRLDVVTLASLVEGEARVEDDRRLVAAVYRNRLGRGMALQADPTVQYAIILATGRRKPRLYEKDYGIESPYNTYLRPGLPPGPVAAPGRASLEAALDPAPVAYLYFVAGPDGRHIFSQTYREHLRAVRRVQRDR